MLKQSGLCIIIEYVLQLFLSRLKFLLLLNLAQCLQPFDNFVVPLLLPNICGKMACTLPVYNGRVYSLSPLSKPGWRSEIMQIDLPGSSTSFLTRVRNYDQLSLFSPSTIANASANRWFFTIMPTTTIKVHLYFLVKKVSSTVIICLQCVKSATHCEKHQNTCFNTGQYRHLSLGNHLPSVLMTHLVPGLKCDMTLNILGTFM
jgi:hypothetical protein